MERNVSIMILFFGLLIFQMNLAYSQEVFGYIFVATVELHDHKIRSLHGLKGHQDSTFVTRIAQIFVRSVLRIDRNIAQILPKNTFLQFYLILKARTWVLETGKCLACIFL